jgi:hypothetical protein
MSTRLPTITPETVIFAVAIGANTPHALCETFGVADDDPTLHDTLDRLEDEGQLLEEPNDIRTLQIVRRSR